MDNEIEVCKIGSHSLVFIEKTKFHRIVIGYDISPRVQLARVQLQRKHY